jgi:magnesium-protoporphyrin O-methyltransferase
MSTASYIARRGELETYFDRTAADAWAKLTSDAPVSSIRATVRAGRDRMRDVLLNTFPDDLEGVSVLDAGCGTGALAVALARRGATVTAIDLSPSLVQLARERMPRDLGRGRIDFAVGDMMAPPVEKFDYVVAMDSLIHYRAPDMVRVVASLAARTSTALVFTFAPRTVMLSVLHATGRLFPRGDRAPAIEPVGAASISKRLMAEPGLAGWRLGHNHRINTGFYKSHALQLVRG